MVHYPNDKGEYKTKGILTKWYPSDLVKIDRQAKQLNLSRTAYITQCTLNKSIEKTHIFKANKQNYRAMSAIAKELNRIGNNINQITKVFNLERLEGGSVPANYPLPEELTALRTYLDRVNAELNLMKRMMMGRTK